MASRAHHTFTILSHFRSILCNHFTAGKVSMNNQHDLECGKSILTKVIEKGERLERWLTETLESLEEDIRESCMYVFENWKMTDP